MFDWVLDTPLNMKSIKAYFKQQRGSKLTERKQETGLS